MHTREAGRERAVRRLVSDERQLSVIEGIERKDSTGFIDKPLIQTVQGLGLEVHVELVCKQLSSCYKLG